MSKNHFMFSKEKGNSISWNGSYTVYCMIEDRSYYPRTPPKNIFIFISRCTPPKNNYPNRTIYRKILRSRDNFADHFLN